MNPLIIEQTDNTVGIVLDKDKKEFSFEGRSLPENTFKFFEPVIDWLAEYKRNPADETYVNMNYIYFNTSSAKVILNILQEFDEIYKAGNKVKIIWHFMEGDDDIKEAGEEYESMVKSIVS